MTPYEFLIEYLEIEPERFESDPYYAIYQMMVEDLSDLKFTKQLVDIMEKYHQINTGKI